MKNKFFLFTVIVVTILGVFKWHAQAMDEGEAAPAQISLEKLAELPEIQQQQVLARRPIDPVLYGFLADHIPSVAVKKWPNVLYDTLSADGSKLFIRFYDDTA